jgi:ubiquitin C-terminal hydrolase
MNPLLGDDLTTRIGVQNYITRHALYPEDYKCEKCGLKNADDNPITQIYRLARLSSVIVLSFHGFASHKKDKRSVPKYFPPQMSFNGTGGKLLYKVVAQIEHSGTVRGGHYIAKCLRKSPSNNIQLYCCNDSLITAATELKATPNTYMVFYHLL